MTMLQTVLTEKLKVEYPIMLAGMGGVSYAEVVAAVSNAGGYGTIGAAGMGIEIMVDEMKKVRDLTDKPFGVDMLTAGTSNLEDYVEKIIEGGASSFVAGLGVPANVVEMCHEAGLLVISMCGKVKHAKMAEDAGCDIIVAQGTEAGGHTGQVAGVALWPQVVDAVSIPVVAAGGIFDGRALVAAFAFGCTGIWVGTRFIASTEAHAHQNYKDMLIEATEADTIISRCWTGKTLRAVRNEEADAWEKKKEEIKPFPIQAMTMHQGGKLKFSQPNPEGEPDKTTNCFPAGQGTGAINDVKPCKEIVDQMVEQAEAILKNGVVPKKPAAV